MKEIEIKLLEIDKEKIISKLEGLGAKKLFEGDTLSLFFEVPEGETLRLRQEGERKFITHKKSEPGTQAKIAEELETEIIDIKEMKEIIEALGHKFKAEFKKHRIEYKLGKAKYEIDTWPKIPAFLEVEAPTEEDIKKALEMIGLDIKNGVPWTAKEVYKHYGKEYE